MTSDSTLPSSLQTPVLFIVFNRPETTSRVFEAIRQAKPPRLYVAADGPRASREGETERIARVRRIATAVEWPCEVFTLFREENLGCKRAVSEAITWFFRQEERGIILEDDCLPHQDFFSFCEALLVRYADDERVSVITGDNFQDGIERGDGSYYFSRYNHVWGWASWRRAWQHCDIDLTFWPEWKRTTHWRSEFPDGVERRYWEKIFDRMHAQKIDTWDYPWTASVWYHGGLTATPNVNLISNIGFGEGATHTTATRSKHAALPIRSIGNLKHPSKVVRDSEADRWIFNYNCDGRDLRFPRNCIIFPRRVVGYLYRRFSKLL